MRRPLPAAAGLILVLAALPWLLLRDGSGAAPEAMSVEDGHPGVHEVPDPSDEGGDLHLPSPDVDAVALLDPSHLPPVEAPVSRGVLRIRARWATSREPAPGVELVVTAWDEPDRARRTRTVRTDAEGLVGFREVAAGLVTVDAPRGGEGIIKLAADGTADLDVLVSDDLLVRGRVLDGQGRPAARASIWVSIHPRTEVRIPRSHELVPDALPPRLEPVEGPVDTEWGRFATRTDGAGRFELKGLAPGQGIAALDDQASPSPLLVLEDDETYTLDVTLQLGPPGATLEGRVVDSLGAPVADAAVCLRPPQDVPRPVLRLLTDADGRFVASGLPPGALRVEGSTSAGAARELALNLTAGRTGYVTVMLP